MISLKSLQIDFSGTVEEALAMPLTVIPEVLTHFGTGTLWTQNRRRYLEEVESIFIGGYGIVYELNVYEKREGGRLHFLETVYEKRSKTGGTVLFIEACLQLLAHATLTELGLGYAISPVRDILRWPDGDISFTMTPFNEVKNLHEMLGELVAAGLKGRAFDVWFVPIFVQIIVLMGLLEERLNLNHRDLKGDNILVSLEGRQRNQTVEVGGARWSYIYRQSVHVIDFGFACRGPAPLAPASASSGTFFASRDICPKGGRDPYILLCYFYAQESFRAAASSQLLELVRRLIARPQILQHLEEFGTRRTKYLYFLLGTPEFDVNNCCTAALLGELAAQWPTLIERL